MSQPNPPRETWPHRPPPQPYRPVDATQPLPVTPPTDDTRPATQPFLPGGLGQSPPERPVVPGGYTESSAEAPSGRTPRPATVVLIAVAAVLGLCLVGGLLVVALKPSPDETASPTTPGTSAGPLIGPAPTDDPSVALVAPPSGSRSSNGGQTATKPAVTTKPAARPTTMRPTVKPSPRPSATPRVQQGVRIGELCSPAGGLGMTSNGKPVVCRSTARDPELKWYPF